MRLSISSIMLALALVQASIAIGTSTANARPLPPCEMVPKPMCQEFPY